MSNAKEVVILLAEDDPGHARLIEKNLRRARIANDIIVKTDGQQTLDFLFSDGEPNAANRHDALLVLLDLNMPVVDGYEVLSRMKKDARTRRIPVIVLTTTDDRREVARCYDLGCNIYITKPVEYGKFVKAVHSLGLFLSVVTIPEEVR
jgi:CheY-like chemotaxis protein